MENLRTEDKTDIVSAINEVSEGSNYDACCAVSGVKNIFSNNTAFMSLTKEGDENYLVLTAPFVVTSASGKKYTFTEDLKINLIDYSVQDGKIYSIYLSLEPDELGHIGRVIISEGLFHRQAHRPYLLSKGDGWLDTSSAPYRFILVELDEYNKLIEVEHDYVFLGNIEQDAGDD